MTLHPNVELAEGVTIPKAAWYLHGNVLLGGFQGHGIIIRGFPLNADGSVSISFDVYPLDEPCPLRFRES